jgi:AcrR family transcriptional regulator
VESVLIAPSIRRRGRRAATQQAVGKDVIVETARELLRVTPWEQISLSAVAKAVGCDPALIRYYFGDLKGVFMAVAALLSDEMHTRARDAIADSTLPPRLRLRSLLRTYLDRFRANPHHHKLFVELVLQSQDRQGQSLRRSAIDQVFAEIEAALKGIAEAPGGRSIDPVFAYLSLFGMIEFFVTGRPIHFALRPADFDSVDATAERYLDFMVDLFAGPDPSQKLA